MCLIPEFAMLVDISEAASKKAAQAAAAQTATQSNGRYSVPVSSAPETIVNTFFHNMASPGMHGDDSNSDEEIESLKAKLFGEEPLFSPMPPPAPLHLNINGGSSSTPAPGGYLHSLLDP